MLALPPAKGQIIWKATINSALGPGFRVSYPVGFEFWMSQELPITTGTYPSVENFTLCVIID